MAHSAFSVVCRHILHCAKTHGFPVNILFALFQTLRLNIRPLVATLFYPSLSFLL